jgi:hypothetical protein
MALFRRRKEPSPPRLKPASSSALRRERRALKKLRDNRLRDLGGLMLELYRRGTFREDLVAEQCAQLVGIDDRLATMDAALHRGKAERRCACGSPILRGARFCPSCGRGIAPLRPQTAVEETIVQTTPEG